MREFWDKIITLLTDYGLEKIMLALLTLFVGWAVAVCLKKLTFAALRRCRIGAKLSLFLSSDEQKPPLAIDQFLSWGVFWLVFLPAIVEALNILNLGEAAAPLRNLLASVTGYLPNLIAAGLLGFAAWAAASVARYGALLIMQAVRLDEKVEQNVDTGGRECNLSATAASILYWLVILAFAPAILGALRITGLARPFEAMTGEVFRYLPRLAAAGLITAGGLFLAVILRNLTERTLLAIPGIAEAEKAGGKCFRGENIAKLGGITVFALAVVPVAAAALTALKIDALTNAAAQLFSRAINSAGNLLAVGLILFAAYAVGSAAGQIGARILAGAGFDEKMNALGWARLTAMRASAVIGKLILAAVLIFALIGSLEILQLEKTAELARSFVPFAGRILLGCGVFLLGMIFANIAAAFIKQKGVGSRIFEFAVKLSVLFFAGAAALNTAGIGGPAALLAFGLVLGAFAAAFAIAFGLGGRNFAEHKLNEWEKQLEKHEPSDSNTKP